VKDTSLEFNSTNGNRISISDIDDGEGGISIANVTLTANSNVTLSTTAGLTFTEGDGTDDNVMSFNGTIAAINTALDGMIYLPSPNNNDNLIAGNLTILTDDEGHTGNGGVLSDQDTVTINITPVNDAPVNTVPGTQEMNEGAVLEFNSTNGNQISIADVDITEGTGTGRANVTLVATSSLSLSTTSGLVFSDGDGKDDSTMSFTGLVAAINAALNGMIYTPTDENTNGAGSVTITTDDQANTGDEGVYCFFNVVLIN